MMFLFLIINLGVALWVFYDSQKRGFTFWKGLFWASGVFFLLIIFLPLYLIVRSRKEGVRGRARPADLGARRACFYCGQPYGGQPERCPNCGQNLKPL